MADFRLGDAEHLDFPDGSFDRVNCSRVLIHLEQPDAAVKEMARVLSPGGRLAIIEPDFDALMIDSDDLAASTAVRRRPIARLRNPDIGRRLRRRVLDADLRLEEMSAEARPSPHCSTPQTSSISSSTWTINQARALIVTGPDDIRARFARHSTAALVTGLAALRPRPGDVVGHATRIALRELGRRAEFLDGQLDRLDELIAPLVAARAPSLLARYGIGPNTAALLGHGVLLSCRRSPGRSGAG